MYSNLVLAVPHAVGEVSIPALAEEATVKAWVARWTDWATDVLFGGKIEGDSRIAMVKARYSRRIKNTDKHPRGRRPMMNNE